jgi:uridine phosphorylase
MSVHLNPILPATHDAILVGDPRRAFALGQTLTVQPAMSHLSRGLWGYRGVTDGGLELTVQATGVGGPSAVAVISDLAGMGVRRVVRLGTCTATGRDAGGDVIEPGRAFLVSEARCGDGASRTLSGGASAARPDAGLFRLLSEVAEPAVVFSHDLVARMDPHAWPAGPPLRDLQTAATFAAARALGVESAAVLVVGEAASGVRLDEAELESVFNPLGLAVARVLEAISNPQPES